MGLSSTGVVTRPFGCGLCSDIQPNKTKAHLTLSKKLEMPKIVSPRERCVNWTTRPRTAREGLYRSYKLELCQHALAVERR